MYSRLVPLIIILFFSNCVSAEPKTGFVDSDGVKIYYEVYGKGQPLLLLQGGPGFSSQIIKRMATGLQNKYQLILFDPRGTGKSKLDNLESITMEQMADDVEAVRKAVGCERWAVFGKSWGGTYAAFYTSRFPNRVTGLILSASAGIELEDYAMLPIDYALNKENSKVVLAIRKVTGVKPSTLTGAGTKMRYNQKEDEASRNNFSEVMTQGNVYNVQVANRVFNAAIESKLISRKSLSAFSMPTLIIHGLHDYINIEVARKTARLIPNAQLIVFDKSAHLLELDEPDKFSNAFHSFLSKL